MIKLNKEEAEKGPFDDILCELPTNMKVIPSTIHCGAQVLLMRYARVS